MTRVNLILETIVQTVVEFIDVFRSMTKCRIPAEQLSSVGQKLTKKGVVYIGHVAPGMGCLRCGNDPLGPGICHFVGLF